MIGVTNMHSRDRHYVVVALLLASMPLAAQTPAISWTSVADGVEHTHFRREAPGGGHWNINALRIDMSKARLDVVRARDAAIGLETVTSLADRMDAIAAVNGGYFRTSGDFLGDSTGTLQIDGVLWSEPDRARASVGIIRTDGGAQLVFGHVVWDASIHAGRQKHTVDGLNRARGPNDLVVFTPQFGPATITDDSGVEVVVRSDRVTDVRDNAGSTPIPSDGYIVSARGRAREWVLKHLRPQTRVRVQTTLRPAESSRENPWADAEDVLGAGPKLVTNGKVDVTDVREKMIATFASDLHPRTAIAALADGRALLLTADGRRPPERVGLALDDLAKLLIELGAREAINLDGGGSTAMVVDGKLMNFPTDATGERPVSDAIVVRPRQDRD
jgi:exopolysaccharide biosynthesis protein